MQNQIIVNQSNVQTRDIEIITNEIVGIKTQAQNTLLAYACEIGKRLCEAKDMLNHGEWGSWLKEKVEFSQSTANNYMKLYDEYGDGSIFLLGFGTNSQTFANIDYSKAIKLLALPSDERENFIIENDIENKSVRETDKLIKEHKEAIEAKKRLEEENARLSGYQKEASDNMIKALTAQRKLTEKERELEKVKAELKELKATAIEESPALSDEELDKIKADARKEAEEKFKEDLKAREDALKNEIAAAKAEKAQAEARAKEANDKISEFEKQTKLANPLITEFKTVFEDFQDKTGKLLALIEEIQKTDQETGAKLKGALCAFVSQI